LKLSLAQFRELEAFAQFASDLDPETKAQIDRGQRLTELLKQPQYSPMPVAEQVVSIYAADNGYFDDTAVENIKEVESKLLAFFRNTRSDLLEKIASGSWSEDEIKGCAEGCTEFKKSQ
jgi:F-type H+/Na+-transporting ATPase subunit alpha